MAFQVWVEAARPRTLTAAVAPVVVGTAVAQDFVLWRFVAALIVALAIQVAVNYANDYADGVRGVDTPERVGPRRLVAAGVVRPKAMKRAVALALLVAAVAGLTLAVAVTWWLVVVGLVCVLAALAYSGGPRPYADAGLGEVFVFLFFGLVATVGSAYVQDATLHVVALVAAVPIGLLAVTIMLVNNLRDIETDQKVAKHTLAVRLGERGTRALIGSLVLGAFLFLPATAAVHGSVWPLLAVVSAPLGVGPVRDVLAGAVGPRLLPVLGAAATLQIVFAGLLAAGLALGAP